MAELKPWRIDPLSGNAGKVLRVNAAGTEVEYASLTGGGGDPGDDFIPYSEKGAASGVAPLNGSTKIDIIYLPVGTASGIAPLDGSSKVPIANLPSGVANGLAPLDGSGKINSSYLPAIAITTPFVVASQAAMLALTAEEGDVAIRTDIQKNFILKNGGNPTVLADWLELQGGSGTVTSVNGLTGTVVIGPNEIAGLTEYIQDVVAAFIVQGTNITKTYDDVANTLTLAASGGSGGGGGDLLYRHYYNPASVDVNSTASVWPTFVDLDATNLIWTFVVPASGEVFLEAEVLVAGNAALGIREGSTTIADSGQVAVSGSTYVRVKSSWLITGLTPGVTKTYKLAMAVGSGTGYVYCGGGNSNPNGSAILTARDAVVGSSGGSGGGGSGGVTAYRVRRAAAGQSIPNNSATALSWDTGDLATGAYDAANPTRWVAPVTGRYRMIVAAKFTAASSGVILMDWYKNGVAKNLGWTPNTTSPVQCLWIEYHDLVAGDYFVGNIYQNSGSAKTIDIAQTYIVGELLSEPGGSGGGGVTHYKSATWLVSAADDQMITLAEVPEDNTLQVFYNGQLLTPGSGNDYTIPSPQSVVFASPLPAGVVISVHYWTAEEDPADSTIGPYTAATTFVGTGGTFTHLSYSYNFSFTLPTGVQPGDWMFCLWNSWHGWGVDSNWTTLYQSGGSGLVYKKVVGETGGSVVTPSSGGQGYRAGCVLVIVRGADATTPVDDWSIGGAAVTAGLQSRLLIHMAAHASSGTNPSPMSRGTLYAAAHDGTIGVVAYTEEVTSPGDYTATSNNGAAFMGSVAVRAA